MAVRLPLPADSYQTRGRFCRISLGGVDADHCRSTCSKPWNVREHSAAAASGQRPIERHAGAVMTALDADV